MINYLIGELIRVTGLSGTDRFLGMAFGAARGALLVVVAVGLLSLGPVQQDGWWQESRSCQISIGRRLVQKPDSRVEQSVACQRNQRTR
jgi:uncharacterized membrane protein required for colicin V production